jgi:hypothetical protein
MLRIPTLCLAHSQISHFHHSPTLRFLYFAHHHVTCYFSPLLCQPLHLRPLCRFFALSDSDSPPKLVGGAVGMEIAGSTRVEEAILFFFF